MKNTRVPLLLVAIGFLAILTALGILLHPRIFTSPQKELLPSNLGGLPLNQAIYGPEAIDGVIQLHGVDFPMEEAAIGQYGSQGEVIVWVSIEADKASATELTSLMTEKINQGRSPFTLPIIEEFNGTTIYVLDGLGQRHYYWQRDNRIFWIAVDFSLSDAVLEETLAFYR